MDYIALLQEIFELCIIPLLGILTTYAVKYLRARADALRSTQSEKTEDKYLAMLNDTIAQCVVATNQIYVEALKGKNAFDADAQKQAFTKTFENVMSLLSAESKEYLAQAYGDLDLYIKNRIEAEVNFNKK